MTWDLCEVEDHSCTIQTHILIAPFPARGQERLEYFASSQFLRGRLALGAGPGSGLPWFTSEAVKHVRSSASVLI